ncbi:putative aldouronate transport system substrate-binding protein [Paenibacillus endophyticus]|uniref:Putative aldouronate transport system substrate-binding protein n=1 Tax=Paenibacillus endophyticus TaxID=1294268 RepID=A0A7W5CBV6_9BACL|nr:ABC transporter substrate-binding protein [Paenibacillus endophyticus]MBB3154805.1 putative aldouronate transport system substrate-binding protein [Paenibacillus endophyticus]
MKQVKQKTSMLLLMMMTIVLIVSGCSGNGNKNNAEATKEPAAATEKPAATEEEPPANELKPYQLSLVYPGTPQTDEKKIEEALNKILTEKINATIDLRPIDWGAWDDKINLMVASQEEVDIVFTAQWNGHAKYVAKGAFLDLGELLEQYGKGITDSLDPAFIEGAKINGKNYGVPTNKELAALGGIVYRKDVTDELGIDMTNVKTPQDLDAVYAVIKAKRPDLTPLYTTGGAFNSHFFANYDFLGDSTIPGAILKDLDGTKVAAVEEIDRYKEFLNLTRDYFKKGYINADAATTQVSSSDAWKAGTVFSTLEPLKPGKDAEVASAAGLSGKLAQISMSEKTVATSETAGSMLGVSFTSKDPARAMMLINLLHTDKEINNILNFGIEGDHFTRNGEIITATDNTANYNPGSAWMFGNQFLNYVWDTEDPEKWAKFKEFNQNAKVSPGLGFVFDSEPVKAEVGALANVIRQYQRALETGSVDVDKTLADYEKKLKDAGVEKVVAEKQKQFDAFLASK